MYDPKPFVQIETTTKRHLKKEIIVLITNVEKATKTTTRMDQQRKMVRKITPLHQNFQKIVNQAEKEVTKVDISTNEK